MRCSSVPAYLVALLVTLFLHSNALAADTIPQTQSEKEIHYLIQFIADSGATFIRNGSEHTAKDAAEHLAMKYRRASRYAATAEDFIDNLASKSSITRKPYTVVTADGEHLSAHDWLYRALQDYRQHHNPRSSP